MKLCWLQIEILLPGLPLLILKLKILKRVEEDRCVMHFAHRILVVVHLIRIVTGIIGKERLDGLDHVAQLLEGDPHPMDGIRVTGVELAKTHERLGVCAIHCLQDLLHEVSVIRMALNGLPNLLYARLEISRLSLAKTLASGLRQIAGTVL